METRVFDELSAAGFDDITPAQARVFQRIAPGGSRLTDLAAQAGIMKQSAGFLVDQLERTGYVERVPDPADRRARLVRVGSAAHSAWRPPAGSSPGWRGSGQPTWGSGEWHSSGASSPTYARSPTHGGENNDSCRCPSGDTLHTHAATAVTR